MSAVVTSWGGSWRCRLGRRLPQTGRPNGPGQGGGEGWREGTQVEMFRGMRVSRYVCVPVCLGVHFSVCIPGCVQMYFCLYSNFTNHLLCVKYWLWR